MSICMGHNVFFFSEKRWKKKLTKLPVKCLTTSVLWSKLSVDDSIIQKLKNILFAIQNMTQTWIYFGFKGMGQFIIMFIYNGIFNKRVVICLQRRECHIVNGWFCCCCFWYFPAKLKPPSSDKKMLIWTWTDLYNAVVVVSLAWTF